MSHVYLQRTIIASKEPFLRFSTPPHPPCVPVSDITAYSAVRGKNSQNRNKHTAEVRSLKWLSNRSQPPAHSVQGDSREQALDQPEVSNSFHDEIPALQQPVGFMRSLHCRSFGTLFLLLATRLLVHSIEEIKILHELLNVFSLTLVPDTAASEEFRVLMYLFI